jgi:predicted TPR repeat methyltransferase
MPVFTSSTTSRQTSRRSRTTEPPGNDRALSIDEALAVAVVLQQAEQWAAAAEIYRSILEVAPDHAGALHFSGVLAHQQEQDDDVALIARSIELEPDRPDWYSNLGIVLQDRLRLDEAIAAYEQAIGLDPTHANAHNNLGVVLRAKGRVVEAEAAYRAAIQVDPDHADAYNNLGVLLNGLGRQREAALCFSKVITLRPKHPEARRLLALAHYTLGEAEKAIDIFDEWLRDEPDDPIARHMLAACSGREVPARASDAFIEKTFDSFAASFDAKLASLAYRAPALVAEMLAHAGVNASRSLDVVDAGCGTGLCGPLIAPYARRLVGVDLSEAMLARARARNVYDELAKRELTAYLRDSPGSFDVIVSADALVYFGPLKAVAAAAANALRPGGVLVFTVEELDDDASDAGHSLSPNGRYRHSHSYLERVLADAGLQSEIVPAELRLEAGEPVAGLVVQATKVHAGIGSPGEVGTNIGSGGRWLSLACCREPRVGGRG